MKEIICSQGKIALVDDGDYEYITSFGRWSAICVCRSYYARKHDPKDHDKSLSMHRLVWERNNGAIPDGLEIDHINCNGLDNRMENLRTCTHKENMSNQPGRLGASSQHKGVYWDKQAGKWKAQICHSYKVYNLGRYKVEKDAALAYNAGAIRLFGPYAHLNDISE